MIGAGILFRILRRSGGRLLEGLGILPARYYLREALEALSRDDLPRVIQSLEWGRGGPPHRWELIRQQAVFRCRILKERHSQSLRRLERGRQRLSFEETPEPRLEEVIELHRLAISILSDHEAALLHLSSSQLPS